MAEQRQKSHGILLRTEGKLLSLELFDAALWPEQAYDDGLYRVRINGVWHSPTGKFSFLSLAAVGELVATLLAGPEGAAAISRTVDPPYLPYKAEVGVYVEDAPRATRGSVQAPPHQERDGRWYVWVWLFGRGPVKLPCNDVQLLRMR